MSTEFVNQENQQWRSNNNLFRAVTIKGIDTQVFEDGELMMYDDADDTFIKYTGAAVDDRAIAILSLGVGETLTLDVADTLTPRAQICIGGEVLEAYLVYPGAFTIDDRPNAAVQSIRLQLREVGIIARDADSTVNGTNINP